MADSLSLQARGSNLGRQSLNASYEDIVSKLDDFLYGGKTLSEDPHLAAAPTIATSLIALRVWAADIGAQDSTNTLDSFYKETLEPDTLRVADIELNDDTTVLGSLYKHSPDLGARVGNRLAAIKNAINDLEAVLKARDKNSTQWTKELTVSSNRISHTVLLLTQLTEDIVKHSKEVVRADLASTVHSVLQQRTYLSRKPGIQTEEPDFIKELAYSDEESRQRRRHRPIQRRKSRPQPLERTSATTKAQSISAVKALPSTQKSAPAKFQYPPISKDQIRLATVFPGRFEDPIKFSIQVTSLSILKSYEYEAVSYAWEFGESADVEITMTPQSDGEVGESGHQTKLIRSHAANAIRRLRHKDASIILWIDVLCIELNNDEEIAAQKQGYAPVFAQARRVNLWVENNEDFRDTMKAFEWMQRLSHLKSLEYLNLTPETQTHWVNFLWFMHLRVFRRCWVAQEIIIAQDVSIFCGEEKVCWQDLVDAIALWQRAKSTNPALASKMYRNVLRSRDILTEVDPKMRSWLYWSKLNEDSRTMLMEEGQKTSAEHLVHTRQYLSQKRSAGNEIGPEELIHSLSWTEYTRTRNVLYAAISLGWGTTKSALEGWPWSPSGYTPLIDKSLSDKTVVMRFIARCIRVSGSLDIILQPWLAGDIAMFRPPWIRNFRTKYDRSVRVSFVGPSDQGKRLYNASAAACPSYRFADEKSTQYDLMRPIRRFGRAEVLAIMAELDLVSHHHFLFVNGIEVGTITRLSPINLYELIYEVIFSNRRSTTFNSVAKRMGVHLSNELFATLVGDRTAYGDRVPSWYYKVLDSLFQGNLKPALDISERDRLPEAIKEVLTRVIDVTWNRRLIRIDDKFIGLGPEGMVDGDQICVLFGCNVPVVLRRLRFQNPIAYELIGECFVYGFMDGEALSSGKKSSQFMLV